MGQLEELGYQVFWNLLNACDFGVPQVRQRTLLVALKAQLGVDGRTIAEEAPHSDFVGLPRLTVKMAAIVQGFPPDWEFAGKKTPAYRQVGNAFPPPVAKTVGESIASALFSSKSDKRGVA